MEDRHFLTKEEIENAKDWEPEAIEVPEWGGWVLIRPMSGFDRDRIEVLASEKKDMTNLRAEMVVASICDSKGKKVFTRREVGALGNKSGVALDRVFARALILSGLKKEVVEDIAKNSEGETDEESFFDSVSPE